MAQKNVLVSSKKKKAQQFLQQNDLRKAQELYEQIVKSSPMDYEAQYYLGLVYARSGSLKQAEFHLQKAVDISPALAEGWLNLGQISELSENFTAAEKCYLKAKELKPGLPDIYASLGRIYLIQGDYERAIMYFKENLKMVPDNISSQISLASATHLSGQFLLAERMYADLLKRASSNLHVHLGLGNLYKDMGKGREALEQYRLVRKIAPDHVLAVVGEAEELDRQGQPQEAYDLLAPLVEKGEKTPAVMIVYSRLCMQLGSDSESIETMLTAALENDKISFSDRAQLHIQLGNVLDKRKAYKEAFEHYDTGNRIVWENLDDSKYEDPIENIIELFSRDNIQKMPHAAEDDSVSPIFIVGMPRSGTSLVEQILASHSNVFGAGELMDIGAIAQELNYSSPSNFNPTKETLNEMAARYLSILKHAASGEQYVTDKMPHNFLYLGLISLLFPNARVIHCKRDPLDTCLSCYFQNFNFQTYKYKHNLEHLGLFYKKYEKLMEHWYSVLEMPILDVQYEELVDSPEDHIKKIVSFCGLEWEEQCLNFHENKRVVYTASYNQVRRPLYKGSVERWKNYEAYIEPLRKSLGME